MDFNPPEETSSHPIPRCSSANSLPSSLDLYEPTGETNRNSFANYLRSYIGFYEPSTYGNVQSCLSNHTNEYIFVEPSEQIQHAMNFEPNGETSRLPSSSSASSLPSSLDLSELSMSIYLDAQLYPTNHTNEYIYGVLPEPFDLETNYQPLPSYGVEFRQTIGREAPFNREEFSGWNQYSMPPVLGPQGETHWEAIQRLDREYLLRRRTSLDAMQENRHLKFRIQMLENNIVDLVVKNQDLEIRNNHSELKVMYLETTSDSFSSLINQLKDKVAGLELIITQRDLNRLTIRMNEMNCQMANVEAKFTQLKDEVNQLKVKFSNPRTKVTRLACVNKLKGAIKDFKRCRTNVKQNTARLTSEICEFSATVADLETSDAVTELKTEVINLETQIMQLFARASALKKGLVPLEKILEKEHNKASRQSTTGEFFAQFWEDLKRVLLLG